jgi:ectoine hydroxylase-related dioxygenase (phytanoyl-CoA dioxygenase family)
MPGSHRWSESRVERTDTGAVLEGIRFNVPAVTAIKGSYTVERPNPRENQVLVFSPYLVHGGAVNLNNDKTRISIEMRLWKK